MKKNSFILLNLVFLIPQILFAQTIPESASKNTTTKYKVEDIFPIQKGFYWYYEGPNDSEKSIVIDSIEKNNDVTTLNIKAINEDLSGERKLKDRIYNEQYIIGKGEIVQNESVILKEPLEVGNLWTTKYDIKTQNKRAMAEIKITSVAKDKLTTKLIVRNLNNYVDKMYIEITTYGIGKGIISQWYNYPFAAFNEFKRGFDLREIKEKPYYADLWCYPPYTIKVMKENGTSLETVEKCQSKPSGKK